MGTGTTGIAAVKLKRRFIGIEKNPDKLLKARGRISDFLDHHNEGEEKTMIDNSSSSSRENSLLTVKSRISDFLGHQNEGEEKIMNAAVALKRNLD